MCLEYDFLLRKRHVRKKNEVEFEKLKAQNPARKQNKRRATKAKNVETRSRAFSLLNFLSLLSFIKHVNFINLSLSLT